MGMPKDDYVWNLKDWSAGITAELKQYRLRGMTQMDFARTWEQIDEMILKSDDLGKQLKEHSPLAGEHNYEIDFLLSRKAKVCPIEVKSSTSNVHVSIDEFQKKFSARILQRYLLHSKDIRKEQDLIMLPMYMAMFL